MKEHELIKKVQVALEQKLPELGPQYEIISQSEWLSRNLKAIPDLVVHDKRGDHYFVIEVKYYDQPRPLSLSAVPMARLIKAENRPLKIDVAIVTNSDITEPLRIGLEQEHIPVIKYTTADQAVENMIAFISEKSNK